MRRFKVSGPAPVRNRFFLVWGNSGNGSRSGNTPCLEPGVLQVGFGLGLGVAQHLLAASARLGLQGLGRTGYSVAVANVVEILIGSLLGGLKDTVELQGRLGKRTGLAHGNLAAFKTVAQLGDFGSEALVFFGFCKKKFKEIGPAQMSQVGYGAVVVYGVRYGGLYTRAA